MSSMTTILVIASPFIIIAFCFYKIEESKSKSDKIINEITPIIKSSKTLTEVNIAYDLFIEKCYSKNGHCIIDIAWKDDLIRLKTILDTKYELLKP